MHRLEWPDRGSGKTNRTEYTIFRLYSMTKTGFGSGGEMILMEECPICTSPVADILPAFAHPEWSRDGKIVYTGGPILMHDLLAMTSGLVYPDWYLHPGQAGMSANQQQATQGYTYANFMRRCVAPELLVE